MQVVKSAGEVEQGRAYDETQPLIGHAHTSPGEFGDGPPMEEEKKIDKKSFLTGRSYSIYTVYPAHSHCVTD